ncbi:MAG: repair protein RadC [Clostridia bacterium]|jgi:DNA repair protein RadC|nr:repair protein RadC [Clostridia bacterium]MDF2892640.1 repair protein RadC [Clostridia bacterium]
MSISYLKPRIKELPENERPREKLTKYGAEVLSNAELLAILLRTGTKNESAIDIAYKLLKQQDGIGFILESKAEELSCIHGIGPAKAAQLKAAVELGKRLATQTYKKEVFIRCSRDAANVVMEDMRYLKKEYMKAILLNIKCGLVSIEEISVGSINSSIVHPREVFAPAIKKSCASLILVHNHPSGDPTPSQEDMNITNRLVEGGKILGIEVVDHIIIGDGKYVSLKDKGIF